MTKENTSTSFPPELHAILDKKIKLVTEEMKAEASKYNINIDVLIVIKKTSKK